MDRFIHKNISENFDLIIIGGGITGATLAYEAGTRGMKVALFEKGDYGSATSSATSKLIHGGLRYLKNFEFGLVRESLRERRILSNIAPNFVFPIPFMLPTYNSVKTNKWILFIGMLLYDLLSFDKSFTWDNQKKLPHFKSLSAKKSKNLENCIKKTELTGSMVYYDCQNIFPERLTLSFLKSAEIYGVKISNFAQVSALIKSDNCVKGVKVKDLISGCECQFKAPIIVNCAGPWADVFIQSTMSNDIKHPIRRSEGIHIITRKLCNEHAVSVMTKNNRHIMLMPWRNHSLIGTTDKEYIGNPDDYKVSKQSIIELLADVNDNYDIPKLKYDDVLFYYGGLRPLTDTQTENSYESSRKYEIYDNADENLEGLISVEGGKFTTSRQLAVEVIKKIEEKQHIKFPRSFSKYQYLYGSEIKDMRLFLDELHQNYPDFLSTTIDYLGKNYGTESYKIFQLARENPKLSEVLNKDGEILAEVVYAIQNESAFFLSDILFRRTGIGTLGYPGNDVLEKVACIAKKYLNWSHSTYETQLMQAKERFNLPVI